MENGKIRKRIEEAGIKYWQLADAVGISAPTLVVWLRHELTGDRLERVQRALDKLCGGGDNGELS